jgi:hypothetical protein
LAAGAKVMQNRRSVVAPPDIWGAKEAFFGLK